MKNYILKAEEKVSSHSFYYKLVPKILEILRDMENGEGFVLDFSETKVVDAMAVPLLLNMARWIIGTKEIIPQIYIPNLREKDKLKRYLEQVGFFNICDFYSYFEVNTERITTNRDSTNLATYVFTENAKDDSQEERERIEKHVYSKLKIDSYSRFWTYWSRYDTTRNPDHPANGVEMVTRALCANTGIHTKENAILTLQRNKELGRVCISIADCGKGLYEKLKDKGENGKFLPALCSFDKFKSLSEDMADLYAIIEALAYRYYDKIYGLYHVLMKNIELGDKADEADKAEKAEKADADKENGWIMRIHTNQMRVVLTQKNCRGKRLNKTISKEQFANKLLLLAQSEYVAKPTLYYPGVHIEMEIPYNEEKMQDGLLEN